MEEMMKDDFGDEFFWKGRRRGEVPGNNNALAHGEILDRNIASRSVVEFGDKFLHTERNKPFFLRWTASYKVCE